MADRDLDRRLRAVERAIAGDEQLPDLTGDAELVARVDDAIADVDDLSARLDALDAAVQAVRGYVGHVGHVNERVERRANAACAAVDRLEAAVEADRGADRSPTSTADGSHSTPEAGRVPVASAASGGAETAGPSEAAEPNPPPNSTATDGQASRGLLARLRTLL